MGKVSQAEAYVVKMLTYHKIAKVRGLKLLKKVEIPYKVDQSAQIFSWRSLKTLYSLCESLSRLTKFHVRIINTVKVWDQNVLAMGFITLAKSTGKLSYCLVTVPDSNVDGEDLLTWTKAENRQLAIPESAT